MAKLTARFELQDRISKKLKYITGQLDQMDRRRKRWERPVTVRFEDRVTKGMLKLQRFILRDFQKAYSIQVKVNDMATRQMKKIDRYMQQKMPKTHDVILKAVDQATPMMKKLQRYMNNSLMNSYAFAITAKDQATPVVRKIATYVRNNLQRGYSVTISVIDKVTKTVGRIANYSQRFASKSYSVTFKAVDMATRTLGSIKSMITSIPSMVTITLGVIGAGKLTDATVGSAMDFEQYTVSMNHWLDGNKEKVKETMDWLGRYADSTPFNMDELFPAMTRGIGLSNGDVKQAQSLLTVASDMAALTPGKTVNDAMEALADAQMGEFERMKEFSMKVTADDYEKMGWDGFINQANDRFSGGADKLSQTARGKLSTITGYIGTAFRQAGDGILNGLMPQLDAVVGWIDNNQDKWKEWKETIVSVATDISTPLFQGLADGFNYLRENYLENEEFRNLDFEGKVKFILDDVKSWWNDTAKPKLESWWQSTGEPWAIDMGTVIGEALFTGIVEGMKGGLGIVGGMWKDAFSGEGSFASAAIGTLIAGSIASMVLSPLTKGISGAWKIGKKAHGWTKGRKGKKGPPSGPSTPPNAPAPKKGEGFLSKALGWGKNGIKRVPILGTAIGGLSLLGTSKDELGGGIGNVAGGAAGATAGAAIGSIVPGVGTVIGGVAGGILGSMGGEKVGQWIQDGGITKTFESIKQKASDAGSSISNTFASVKENIGSTIFSSEWWGEKWESVKSWAKDKLSDTSDWWNGIKQTATETIFSEDWWIEQAGFVWGYLEETLFNSEWWISKWESVKTWAKDAWDGLVGQKIVTTINDTLFNSEWWGEKWESVKSWAKDKWETAQDVWETAKTTLSNTLFSSEWWGLKWDSVKTWTKDKWETATDIWDTAKTTISTTLFSSEWWSGKWGDTKDWAKDTWNDTTDIWNNVLDAANETLFSSSWWSGKWQDVKDWASGTWGDIKEGSRDLFGGINEKFQKGRERGRNAGKVDKNATGGYITKPTISWIGEAGNEFVIPTQNNKGRGKMLLAQAANKLGMNVVDDMQQAATGGSSTVTPITTAPSYSYQPSITPYVDLDGMQKQSIAVGQEFTSGFDTGIQKNVVSMEAWKQKNVKTPMQQMVTYSSTYGKGVVNGFAAGQNATATNTGSYLNRHVRTPFMSAQAEAPSWGTGLMGHFISGMNDSGANVTQAAKDLAERVDKAFREELDIHSPSRRMRANGQFAAIGIIKGLDDVDIENFAKSKASSLAAAFSNMNGVGGDISAWLAAALMATNTPMSWLGPLSMMAQRESGGNPRAINNWDINAKRGTPSKGLMQTIDPTFQAYKGKGMNDIWNPVHNAVASINYIKARYGTVFNTPGMRNMARGGGYRGYANGGLITNEQIARIGEGGKREWIIPEERGIRGHYLLNQAAQSMGYQLYDEGETQIDPGQSAAAIGGANKTVYVEKQGTVVHVSFTGDNIYQNDTDVQAVADAVKKAIVDELEEEIRTGSEGVPDE
ncbi:transglycosylase SLT domain-containing protein [Terribacillus sp. 7520-G]|uniref:transglycosylase SLT domain-containing protein n=1 Tax=Terribacillus sp. 7520-G TaxID=2025389 RepID=UPI000BA4FB2C|nr:transglycosylase SLT domain-containing protein [Terribacillus sp. 7520-G]PAD38605.1 hypothetical protein CHH53_10260 [Terribacillus sp. 7520-G]